jgi:subtilisin-like proprotein convertase family protein
VNVASSFSANTLASYKIAADTGRHIEVSPGTFVDFGTVIVQSAGNDYSDANGDSLNASRYTTTVSAIASTGFAASYSNHGASILLGAPGNEIAPGLGIVTTDLLGTEGYNTRAAPGSASDYTDDFGGTSAAGPIVAAVATLMLDANPLLGWRDVQNILAASATHTGSAFGAGTGTNENGTWYFNHADDWNGGAMHVHSNYGYGHLNAYNAVRMAEVWSLFGAAKTSANEITYTGTFGGLPLALTDNGTFTYAPGLAGYDALIAPDYVAVRLNITHSDWTQLRISIVSAEGTEVVLADGTSGNNTSSDTPLDWTFGVEQLRGERIDGTWTLKITDVAAGSTGTLNGWSMSFFGSAPTTNDVHTLTDEFAEMVALAGGTARRTINDSDGGNDWINGAAVTSNQWLDLRNGFTSLTDGSSFTLIGTIENVVGGDGADTLVGNELANVVLGMRGADRLYGEGGNDTIGTGFGTPGGDTVDGGSGFDYLDYRGAPDGVAVYLDNFGGLAGLPAESLPAGQPVQHRRCLRLRLRGRHVQRPVGRGLLGPGRRRHALRRRRRGYAAWRQGRRRLHCHRDRRAGGSGWPGQRHRAQRRILRPRCGHRGGVARDH